MNRTTYGLGALVGTLAVVAILVVAALISQRAYRTWDLTANKRQSLSAESLRALADLDRDVSLLAFYIGGQGSGRETEDLLKQYANASRRIRYEMIDPQKQVGRTEQYRVTTNETVVIESGDRRETVTFPDETKLTNAVLKVTRDGQRKVYFTTGHGERQIDDPAERGLAQLKTTLEDAGYTTATINVATAAAVPDDADVIVMPGPRADVLKSEAERLRAFLEDGGHLLLMADLPEAATPELAGLVKPYGIDLRNAIVLEPNVTLVMPDPRVAVVEQFGSHAVTSGLKDRGFAGYMPIARPVIPADQPPPGVELTWLAKTSPTSWATPIDPGARNGVDARFDAKRDLKGPVAVAVAATLPAPASASAAASPEASASPAPSPAASADAAKRGRLVVVGDVDFATNQLLNQPANRELAVSAVAWLASADAILSIAERSPSASPLFLTPGQSFAAFLVWLGLPALVTAVGIASWASRRRRHA
jgi:ABC-type uncharacterized transport system involved in gliding motility auxiliary subunit